MTKIEHFSFGFPNNFTYDININDINLFETQDLTGKNVHLRLTLDKSMKKEFNQEKIAEEIKEITHASMVKITFIYNQTTNVRSKEIAEQQDLIKKFKLYADLNCIKYRQSVLTKIEEIQNSLLIDLTSPNDAYRLKYLSLRGSIGIKDGQGKDEIEINFDKFDSGIIGLIGNCGAGKSTLIENCHPFPCMLTRPGSLKDHFYLKDSHRILVYETPTGKQLKISMLIDGATTKGTIRYVVESKESEGHWKSVKTIDGTAPSYNEFVKNTFGSKEIFLRTSFYPKEAVKGMSDLSQATKSEKMALFSVLAGTDYLTDVAKKAKELITEEEKEIALVKGQIKDFDQLDERLTINKKIVKENSAKIKEIETQLEKDSKLLKDYEDKQIEYIKASATFDVIRVALNDEIRNKDSLMKKITFSKNNVDNLREELEDIDTYKEQLAWYEDNIKLRNQLLTEDGRLRDDYHKIHAEYEKRQDEIRKHEKVQDEKSLQIQSIKKEISRLEKSIPTNNEICPLCGAPVSEHKKEMVSKEIESVESKIQEQKNFLEQAESDFAAEEGWLLTNSSSEYKEQLEGINTRLAEISTDVSAIDNYASGLDIPKIKDLIVNLEPRLKQEEATLTELNDEYKICCNKVKDLTDRYENTPVDYTDKINRLKRGMEDSRDTLSSCKVQLDIAEKEIENLVSISEKVTNVKAELKKHQNNIEDYSIINTAFGNNGIQALELDSAAPEISRITNSILEENYGERFSVSFDTQRDTKDKRKIDDFIINVFDADKGRNKRLDLLSSGESVWIKQALHFAFSVIRTRRTGFCFRTRFLDETDGSLDSESRAKYLKMIEAAHCQCNAYQTILITHSQEIKEILEQKIEL